MQRRIGPLLCVGILIVVSMLWGGGGGCGGFASAAPGPHKKVLLTSITALTFHEGEMTAARRTSPIPQAHCVRGPCHVRPRAVQCQNAGDAGGGDVQWRCEAALPNGVEFGEISVSCEGFDNPDDPYVLKGSCGLEYSLTGAPQGGHGGGSGGRGRFTRSRDSRYASPTATYDDPTGSGRSGLGEWVFFALVCAAFWFIFCRGRPSVGDATGGGGGAGGYSGGGGYGGGGGSGGGGFGGYGGGGGTYSRGSGTQTMYEQRAAPPPPHGGGGLFNNFWGGLLGGAVLGNLMARGGHAQNAFRPHGGYNFGGYGQPRGGGGSGGGGGTHTATGFGGTTRR